MGNYLNPIRIGTGRTILDWDCGEYHSCVILDDFSLKCWGEGSSGRVLNILFILLTSDDN